MSVDPVTANGNTGGNFNRYWYANNNPYRFTDPDGRRPRGGGTLCSETSQCETGSFSGDDERSGAAESQNDTAGQIISEYRANNRALLQKQGEALEDASIFGLKFAAVNFLLPEGIGRVFGRLGRLTGFLRISSEARQIASGHAFSKHIGDFTGLGIRTERQFARHIDQVIANPSATRNLARGRTAFWDDATGTVVIKNPADADGGSAFIPKQGRYYFDEVLH